MTSGSADGALRLKIADGLAPIEAAMRAPLGAIPINGPGADDLRQFYGMLRYHLGWADANFASASMPTGKRLRPLLLLRCVAACGGDPLLAAPAAAAIELLHNFTLVHDDVQDESAYRHHRETIWHRWGTAAAINVGDALYAVAHDALYALAEPPANLPAERVLRLARGFDRMALRIVEGQHLDLSHEGEWDGGEARYLEMIAGKTAAIMDFAARAGALIAGADDAAVAACGDFGRNLGLAFQVRDDILGIWGAQDITGKPAADDIRRRKQSLPIVALAERADEGTRAELRRLYTGSPPLDERAVAAIITMLDRFEIVDYCQSRADDYHARTHLALDQLAASGAATDGLREYLALLEGRAY